MSPLWDESSPSDDAIFFGPRSQVQVAKKLHVIETDAPELRLRLLGGEKERASTELTRNEALELFRALGAWLAEATIFVGAHVRLTRIFGDTEPQKGRVVSVEKAKDGHLLEVRLERPIFVSGAGGPHWIKSVLVSARDVESLEECK